MCIINIAVLSIDIYGYICITRLLIALVTKGHIRHILPGSLQVVVLELEGAKLPLYKVAA